MDKINYTITIEDCRDYVKYQRTIPRLKKYRYKIFIPLIIIFALMMIFSLIMETRFFLKAFEYVGGQYSMSFTELLQSDFSSLLFEGVADHFWQMNLPVFGAWAVIFFLAWFISKNDLFHAESSKIYEGLKKQALDIEVSVENEGLKCTGKGSSFVYRWADIIDVYESEKSFLVYVAETSALIVPKRAFSTPEKAKEFYELLNARTRKK